MIARIDINFEIEDGRQTIQHKIVRELCLETDLWSQANLEVEDWLDRQSKQYGKTYTEHKLLNVEV
jgi:hypothetical protein